MDDRYRHGGPFDRGRADAYYCRGYWPHFYRGDTGVSERVEEEDMTLEEVALYREGYTEASEDWSYRKNYD